MKPSRFRQLCQLRVSGYLLAAVLLATPAAAQQTPRENAPYQRAIAAGYKALTLCNAIFTSGRTEAQAAAEELDGIYPEYDAIVPTLSVQVNREDRTVKVTFDAGLPPRSAGWSSSWGCQLDPIGHPGSVWQSAGPSRIFPPSADSRSWPAGDADIRPVPSAALATTVERAFDGSFGSGSRTTGIVIVRDGRIVAERYAPGWSAFTPNRTWSVAKSIAGTLAGIAGLDPAKPANLPEWSARGDPRRTITLDHLLRMASGLHSDTAGNRTDAIYFGGTAVTEQATGWPLEATPGTRFRYANNDSLLATLAIARTAGVGLEFPRTLLFGPIGMRHTQAGIDWKDNYILSSQVWSTARDLARLGELWRNDGVWQGKRILPDGWVKYMTTPSGPQPATGPGYGATLWLFGPKQGLPEGSYAAQGNRGQYIFVIPSARLVVVRRGEDPAGNAFEAPRFVADVLKALE